MANETLSPEAVGRWLANNPNHLQSIIDGHSRDNNLGDSPSITQTSKTNMSGGNTSGFISPGTDEDLTNDRIPSVNAPEAGNAGDFASPEPPPPVRPPSKSDIVKNAVMSKKQGTKPNLDWLVSLMGNTGATIGNIRGKSGAQVGDIDKMIAEKNATARSNEYQDSMNDPTSDLSRQYQQLPGQSNPDMDFTGLSANVIKDQTGNFFGNSGSHRSEEEIMRIARGKNELAKSLKEVGGGMSEGKESDLVRGLGEQLSAINRTRSQFEELENNLGFNLDDYDYKSGSAGGKKVDIPGRSVKGLGRFDWSKDAAHNATKITGIMNDIVKSRAGSAVTQSEMQRVAQEFGKGKFASEEDYIDQLRYFKQLTKKLEVEARAGVSENINETYNKQLSSQLGKQQSTVVGSKSGTTPQGQKVFKTFTVNGNPVPVYNQAEADLMTKAGYK